MVEMKDSDNRGQGSRSDKAVTKTVRLGDLHWKLERLDAIHRQLLTGLAAVGELYRLQDVWTTYSGLLRHQQPHAASTRECQGWRSIAPLLAIQARVATSSTIT